MIGDSENKLWDLFISYANEDREWVDGFLLDALRGAGLNCHTRSAFESGTPLLENFEEAVKQSRRILLILTPAYLSEHINHFVNILAQSYGLETDTWPVIPLILKPVTLPPLLRLLVSIDATERENWEPGISNLASELGRVVTAPEPVPGPPYPGMRSFSQAEGHLFFGRNQVIDDLTNLLRENRFLALVGSSGSGKSSLVQAGLIPALLRSRIFGAGDWRVFSLHPGSMPMAALAQGLCGNPELSIAAIIAQLASQPGPGRILVFVDQFEEMVTQAGQDTRDFQEALRRLAETPDTYVILAVRSDFLPNLRAAPIWPEIQRSCYPVLALDEKNLIEAITRPAEQVQVHVEATLVERMVADAGSEPGVLAYIQETMIRLWDRIERRFLPYRAYEELVLPRKAYIELGEHPPHGLPGVIALRAGSVYESLTPDMQAIARRILMRLTQFGTEGNHTCRQLPVSQLLTAKTETAERRLFDRTLELLTANRLLVLSGTRDAPDPMVAIVHPGLVSGWLRLTGWFEQRRAEEVYRRRVEADADEWASTKKNAFLYWGKKLADLVQWRSTHPDEFSANQEEFTRCSQAYDRRLQRRRWMTVTSGVLVALFVLTYLGIREAVRLQTGSPLVDIDAGKAILGSDDPKQVDHEVSLFAFSIEAYEVSNSQYHRCVDFRQCEPPINREEYDDPGKSNFPVVWITAIQANSYCRWINRRLPTTMEWERAVRGTEGRLFPWGNETLPGEKFSPPDSAVPVDAMVETATHGPHPIFHLVDNVAEWVVRVAPGCQASECQVAWDGKTDTVGFAGGAYDQFFERVTFITNAGINSMEPNVGFRCVATVQP